MKPSFHIFKMLTVLFISSMISALYAQPPSENPRIVEVEGLDMRVMTAEAKNLGVEVAGHVPYMVTAKEASEAGQKSMEHFSGIFHHCSEEAEKIHKEIKQAYLEIGPTLDNHMAHGSYWDQRIQKSFNAENCADMLDTFAKNNTWQVPTLVVFAGLAKARDSTHWNDHRKKYIPRAFLDRWEKFQQQSKYFPPQFISVIKNISNTAAKMILATHNSNVPLLTGTDFSSVPYTFPGFSVHDELKLFVEAGISPLEALKAATLNPAIYFGMEHSTGSIEIGKLADLVLLDADPLKDISNTQRINAVVLNGKLLNRDTLDKLLAKAEQAANPQDDNKPKRKK